MKKIVLAFALFVATTSVNAMEVKGKIRDAKTGEEIIGASVVVKEEPSKGAVSGLDGSFSISVNRPTFTLICTYIGYKSYEIAISEKDREIDIPLASDEVMLGEVTVVASKCDECQSDGAFSGYNRSQCNPTHVGGNNRTQQ